MSGMRFLSKIEQVAAFLRAELGIYERTVEAASRMLEKEGVHLRFVFLFTRY